MTRYIRKHIDDGWTVKDIAEHYGVTTSTVYAWRRKAGIRQQPPAWKTPQNRERAERLFSDGYPIETVARMIGAHSTALAAWFPNQRRLTREEVSAYANLHRRARMAGLG